MPASKIVDIMVIIDVGTILESKGKSFIGGTFELSSDPHHPTNLYNFIDSDHVKLSDKVVFMSARRDYADSGEGTAELAVNLNSGDIVHWRSTSLTKDMNYSVILYKYVQTFPDPNAVGECLTQIAPNTLPKSPLPIINTSNPNDYSGQPTAQIVKNFYWQANATLPYTGITYTWSFMIVDSSNKVLGYCSWDPYFNISA
ncbi:inclusion body family protein [Pseudomonas sp. NFXW11]|uniref:AidA/PixA family protein n=1 Tax=Pseudomonas sp. NFXW11 TaxID=2819531 RepID=UPI003CEAC61B